MILQGSLSQPVAFTLPDMLTLLPLSVDLSTVPLKISMVSDAKIISGTKSSKNNDFVIV